MARLPIRDLSNINDKNDYNGNTALHDAVSELDIIKAKLLIKYGADVNAVNNHGATPLLEFYWGGERAQESVELATLLIDNGADVNAVCSYGTTALHDAAEGGNVPLMSLLIKNGADVNAASIVGSTPLHKAALLGDEASIKFLLDNGANIHAKTITNCTALHNAMKAHSQNPSVSIPLLKEAYVNTELTAEESNYIDAYNAAAIEFFGIEINTWDICEPFGPDF